MTSSKIRQTFRDYFEQHNHTPVASSPVVPRNDPTLLFANAGMNQFKNVFIGIDTRPYTRATSCQKCIRAGGKHNDLDNVGKTPRHHTFFEMLGNFSFGDYFKEEAIAFAWELMTQVYELPAEHMWMTVYEEDDEAERLWRKFMPARRVVRLGAKDNFWEMGDTGPCGPCTEINLDLRSFFGTAKADSLDFDDELCLELWNLVFMQFNRDESGATTPLPRPSVDTGAGLERLASVLQGKHSNYETDIFEPLIEQVCSLSGVAYTALECFGQRPMTEEEIEAGMPHRVIADHVRALAFAIADGALPSNEGRGYVLRRILRRAARYGRRIGIGEPFLARMVPTLAASMGAAYPALNERADHIATVVQAEEERFATTLATGIEMFSTIVESLPEGTATISGADAFKLYDTYGFPLDISQDMARERGLAVDTHGFQERLEEQRARARAARNVSGPALAAVYEELYGETGDTEFVGYDGLEAEARVRALIDSDGARCDALEEGAGGWLVADRTPFYGESGGQEADTGALSSANGAAVVTDVQRPVHNLFAHRVEVCTGRLAVGDVVQLQVDGARREATMRHHTATHLLHAALHAVVGAHATQAGSSVNPERLRFDFHHHAALTDAEKEEIERRVNAAIIKDHPVAITATTLEEAQASGAMMLFDEKYGDAVRMVKIDDISCELCGGTHVARTGCIGMLEITDEAAIAAGVRRIEAVCGMSAVAQVQRQRAQLTEAARALNVGADELAERLARLVDENKQLGRKLKEARSGGASSRVADARAQAKPFGRTTLVVANLGECEVAELRGVADQLRAQMDSYIIVLGGHSEGKCALIAQVSDDQVAAGVNAGTLVRELAARVGGGGGGKPNSAQAGGKQPGKLDEALAMVEQLLDAQ